mgnify:CR=1 FL=1
MAKIEMARMGMANDLGEYLPTRSIPKGLYVNGPQDVGSDTVIAGGPIPTPIG